MAGAQQELDRCRGDAAKERERPLRLRDWVSGAHAARLAETERACLAAERRLGEIAEHHRRQSEWTRLLAAAHEQQVEGQGGSRSGRGRTDQGRARGAADIVPLAADGPLGAGGADCAGDAARRLSRPRVGCREPRARS